MNVKTMFTRRRVLVASVAVALLCLIGAGWKLWWTPERIFRSLAAARHVGGIEFHGFHSDVGKDASYFWRLGHSPEVLRLILASLPFHDCDQGDTDYLRRMFAEEFDLQQSELSGHTAYRGGVRRDAEYILVAPAGRESFYLYMHF